MAYRFKTTKQRSLLMQKIKSIRTKPEISLQASLRKEGLKFKVNYRGLPGNPDIVLLNKKVAIFVDGEFWHGYRWEEKKKKIKGNRAYWVPKIERNIRRDKQNNRKLKRLKWKVIRLWEHEITKGLLKCIQKIKKIMKGNLG